MLEELGVIGPQVPGARNRAVLILKKGSDPFKDLIDRKMQSDTAGSAANPVENAAKRRYWRRRTEV